MPSSITQVYPLPLARALVRSLRRQWVKDYGEETHVNALKEEQAEGEAGEEGRDALRRPHQSIMASL